MKPYGKSKFTQNDVLQHAGLQFMKSYGRPQVALGFAAPSFRQGEKTPLKDRVRVMVALALALWLIDVSTLQAGPRVKPGLRVGQLDIGGQFGAISDAGAASVSSSASALGLEAETIFQPHVDLDWTRWHLWLTGFQAEYSGSGTAEATIDLGGRPPITAGTPVQTDADFTYLTGNVIYDILPTDLVNIGLGLGGGLVGYDLAFQSEISPLRVTTSETLPFAFPLARLAKEIGPLTLLGSVGGLAVDFSGYDIAYLNYDISVNYRIFGADDKMQGHVTVGYQYLEVDYEHEDESGRVIIDVALDGPYVGLALSF